MGRRTDADTAAVYKAGPVAREVDMFDPCFDVSRYEELAWLTDPVGLKPVYLVPRQGCSGGLCLAMSGDKVDRGVG